MGDFSLSFWFSGNKAKQNPLTMQRFPAGRVTGILLSRFRSSSMIAMSGPHAGTGGAARVTSELVTAALFHSVHERPEVLVLLCLQNERIKGDYYKLMHTWNCLFVQVCNITNAAGPSPSLCFCLEKMPGSQSLGTVL